MFLRHLSYFVTLARKKHFAQAAESCHISQPTLSAAIRKLEDDLQVPLVLRGHRFLGLTAEGERVLIWAQQILKDYDGLKIDLSGRRHGLTGVLRLGVIPAVMPAISGLTEGFSSAHPAATIEVTSLPSRAIQKGLETFELDAGVTYLDNEPLDHVRLMPLYKERYFFVTRADSPLAQCKTISWRKAAAERLCLLNEDMQNRRILNAVFESLDLNVKPPVVSNSFLGICSYVCNGGFASIVPHTFFDVFAGVSELVGIDLVDPSHCQMIGFVLTDRDPLPPMAQALLASSAIADFTNRRTASGPTDQRFLSIGQKFSLDKIRV
ncbi:MAG: LysR family transcriptional regulator [Alphaproteobacteria bacterium]|nr:LysR family transcriptional regulator [Alphaproteobacteria bacterium]